MHRLSYASISLPRSLVRRQANDFDDLSGAQELALGELVAEKFGSDFFFLDRFPTQIRPFYTMPCPDDKR